MDNHSMMQFTSWTYVLLVSWIILSAIILLPLSNILFPKVHAQPIIPVVLRFYSFSQIDNPDPPFRSHGEYYFRVTIASPGLPPTILTSTIFDMRSAGNDAGLFPPFSVPVDRVRGNLVSIRIQLIDQDRGTGAPDDIMDLNPSARIQTINLELDLDRGTITGSLRGFVNMRFFAAGNGDPISDTMPFETNGERASVVFTVAVTNFQGWEWLGGFPDGDGSPGASSSARGRWDVFQNAAIDEGLLWTVGPRTTGSMSNWMATVRGEEFTSFHYIPFGPDAVSFRLGRIDVFVTGSDGQLWQLWHKFTRSTADIASGASVTWSRWERFSDISQPTGPLNINSGPAVSTRGENRLDVFVKGRDGSLYWLEYRGDANPIWRNLGKPPNGVEITSDPDSVSWDQNRIDVFVTGSDGQLWHKWCDSSHNIEIGRFKPCNNGRSGNDAVRDWGSWERVGPSLASSPGRPAPERLTFGPTAASFAPNRLDIFVVGRDNQLYHTWTADAGRSWGPWEPIGGPFDGGFQLTVSDPDAVSFRPDARWIPGPQRIDVFARGADRSIWHTWVGE